MWMWTRGRWRRRTEHCNYCSLKKKKCWIIKNRRRLIWRVSFMNCSIINLWVWTPTPTHHHTTHTIHTHSCTQELSQTIADLNEANENLRTENADLQAHQSPTRHKPPLSSTPHRSMTPSLHEELAAQESLMNRSSPIRPTGPAMRMDSDSFSQLLQETVSVLPDTTGTTNHNKLISPSSHLSLLPGKCTPTLTGVFKQCLFLCTCKLLQYCVCVHCRMWRSTAHTTWLCVRSATWSTSRAHSPVDTVEGRALTHYCQRESVTRASTLLSLSCQVSIKHSPTPHTRACTHTHTHTHTRTLLTEIFRQKKQLQNENMELNAQVDDLNSKLQKLEEEMRQVGEQVRCDAVRSVCCDWCDAVRSVCCDWCVV